MDQSPNPKLDELLRLTEENNKILRGMRRAQRLAAVGRVLYWIMLALVAYGTYYYLQPYLKQVEEIYSGAGSMWNEVNGFFGDGKAQ
jgi:hypothetical protein